MSGCDLHATRVQCELETLVRMLHGVREWNDVPGMEEAFKGLPTEADVLIPKRACPP